MSKGRWFKAGGSENEAASRGNGMGFDAGEERVHAARLEQAEERMQCGLDANDGRLG
jgi:hypothetical protein